MTTLEGVLQQRGTIHGDFTIQARCAQNIKIAMREEPGWQKLTPAQKEALDAVAFKVSRILCGDPNEPDHWLDISGYTKLVHNILTTGKSHP